jgi:hypothetical protein
VPRKSKIHPASDEPAKRQAHRVRLPGFIAGEEIGLGAVIQRTATYIGIRSCQGCARRAAALDRWMVFSAPRRR